LGQRVRLLQSFESLWLLQYHEGQQRNHRNHNYHQYQEKNRRAALFLAATDRSRFCRGPRRNISAEIKLAAAHPCGAVSERALELLAARAFPASAAALLPLICLQSVAAGALLVYCNFAAALLHCRPVGAAGALLSDGEYIELLLLHCSCAVLSWLVGWLAGWCVVE
jgi:hypothetical protein